MCWFGRKDPNGNTKWEVIVLILMTRCNQPKYKGILYSMVRETCYFVDDIDDSYLK